MHGPKEQTLWGNIPHDKLKGPTTKAIGCYVVKHKEDRRSGIIGRGGIGSRISCLRMVFGNEGLPIRTAKSATSYPSARSMWKRDPDLENWEYCFIVTGYRNANDPVATANAEELSRQLEVLLQVKYKPLYSSLSMAGK